MRDRLILGAITAAAAVAAVLASAVLLPWAAGGAEAVAWPRDPGHLMLRTAAAGLLTGAVLAPLWCDEDGAGRILAALVTPGLIALLVLVATLALAPSSAGWTPGWTPGWIGGLLLMVFFAPFFLAIALPWIGICWLAGGIAAWRHGARVAARGGEKAFDRAGRP